RTSNEWRGDQNCSQHETETKIAFHRNQLGAVLGFYFTAEKSFVQLKAYGCQEYIR
ncbi:MAG: hypothetical protein RL616_410, partial [Verrucomicrobiota bacterium]